MTWTYGLGIGGGPFSPAGPSGLAAIQRDALIYRQEGGAQLNVTRADNASAVASIDKYNGLKTLDDYVNLYDDEWVNSTFPTGVSPGILSNYTQDLLFSMERLSFNPYAVRRLSTEEELPFYMDDQLARDIAEQSLGELQGSERLFYVDHRNQSSLTRVTDGKYAAACDAYFYISQSSGEFLPLAIRTNTNNSLIYTPQDSAEDWLLAKMIFNANDFFMAQFHHLSNTHYVAEIAYQAAIRTLSEEHPVLAILSRIMYGTFGIRPSAVSTLFAPGAAVDRYFGYTGAAAAQYSEDLYASGYAGAFRSNYLADNLKRRGLINSTGPALKHFPFYENALPIYQVTRKFISRFVDSYYCDTQALVKDQELQAWLTEASGPAQVIDFPNREDLKTTSDLVDILTHIAHLSTSAHHAINLNQLITGAGALPFHPTALYKPIPTAKGVTDVASYLPPLEKCLGLIVVEANFARPLLAGTNRSLVHMFDDEKMLKRMNQATRDANAKFMAEMRVRSEVVRNRTFDQDGLSQGMPFLWKALDPEVIPWSLSI
ncbi:Putative lipoxygenase, lipoxygenase domain superfamily [Septoria linicola]|uniref:Manganese lipoxygenase n=1 Tax=Septoria linicola TaxID=215465 RepID=A0A9Q9AJ52_9PEZI|nr:Putative lipoxygenase, lipoxygenase domain superfamily [Septoria linicola]